MDYIFFWPRFRSFSLFFWWVVLSKGESRPNSNPTFPLGSRHLLNVICSNDLGWNWRDIWIVRILEPEQRGFVRSRDSQIHLFQVSVGHEKTNLLKNFHWVQFPIPRIHSDDCKISWGRNFPRGPSSTLSGSQFKNREGQKWVPLDRNEIDCGFTHWQARVSGASPDSNSLNIFSPTKQHQTKMSAILLILMDRSLASGMPSTNSEVFFPFLWNFGYSKITSSYFTSQKEFLRKKGHVLFLSLYLFFWGEVMWRRWNSCIIFAITSTNMRTHLQKLSWNNCPPHHQYHHHEYHLVHENGVFPWFSHNFLVASSYLWRDLLLQIPLALTSHQVTFSRSRNLSSEPHKQCPTEGGGPSIWNFPPPQQGFSKIPAFQNFWKLQSYGRFWLKFNAEVQDLHMRNPSNHVFKLGNFWKIPKHFYIFQNI